MTTVIKCTEGHYEVQRTSYGEAYVWCSECLVVECDCGRRAVLSTSETLCSCGADHAALVGEELASRGVSDGASHPWEAEYQEWRKKQNEHLLSEETYQLELSRLDWVKEHRTAQAWGVVSEGHTLLQHYLIVGHSSKGLELPHIFSHFSDEVLPIFSSEEAAREFLSSFSLGKGWRVRGFSGGELVSMLFAFHTSVKGVLLDPQPGVLSGDVMVSLVGLNAFMSSVLETRSYSPATGARS